jgi:UDP-N-acetylglucosamine 4,6-dehydratase
MMMKVNYMIGREKSLFYPDIVEHEQEIENIVKNSKFLVVGGAGSIGQAVVREIFKRGAKKLDVVDISENNLVELVRRLRSEFGYTTGEFNTFTIDVGSLEFELLLTSNDGYDFVLNLSALKHVRSEKDAFTLMRLLDTNIIKSLELMQKACVGRNNKYFCVSTDKAANPANIMGASKRIMEMSLISHIKENSLSMARFANVAFSDGSLLHGFNQRFLQRQPITAPLDVLRYFLSPEEAGELCLMSAVLGKNMELFFPKLSKSLDLIKFSDIALKFIKYNGYKPYICSSEEEARSAAKAIIRNGEWPCYFFNSDTTGEKQFEEFYTQNEEVDLISYKSLGIVQVDQGNDALAVEKFLAGLEDLKMKKIWSRENLIELVKDCVPEFNHIETGKFLDQRM